MAWRIKTEKKSAGRAKKEHLCMKKIGLTDVANIKTKKNPVEKLVVKCPERLIRLKLRNR